MELFKEKIRYINSIEQADCLGCNSLFKLLWLLHEILSDFSQLIRRDDNEGKLRYCCI